MKTKCVKLSAAVFLSTLCLPSYAMAMEREGAYDPVAGWKHLWKELMFDITVIGVLFAAVALYWMFRYRTDSLEEVGDAPRLTPLQSLAWALIPAFVFMADDFFLAANGWTLWNVYRRVPENALEVKVTAYSWGWEYDYGDGVTSDVLNVPAERPVVLRMTSDDVVHSFFLPLYHVKEDVMPGRITYLWFLPHEGDRTFVTCTEYCGTGHAQMSGDVVAMPEKEFDEWLKSSGSEAGFGSDAPNGMTGAYVAFLVNRPGKGEIR